MKIEVGKYYRSSEGKKVGPMQNHTLGNFIETSGEGLNEAVGEDLTEEWREPSGGGFFEGDKIRCIADPTRGCRLGDVFTTVARSKVLEIWPSVVESSVAYRDHKGNITWRPGTYFELVENRVVVNFDPSEKPSPVKSVTRKEIVPGTYGRLSVINTAWDKPAVGFIDRCDTATPVYYSLSVEELREAAEIFEELADALEFNHETA